MSGSLRFSFDIGTNSIGWAVLEGRDEANAKKEDQGENFHLERIVAAGARIYSDGRNPKDGKSLAEMRRGPRGARRRRDRLLQRKRKLSTLLTGHGFTPTDGVQRNVLSKLDPYELRARALYEPLSPGEFARVSAASQPAARLQIQPPRR